MAATGLYEDQTEMLQKILDGTLFPEDIIKDKALYRAAARLYIVLGDLGLFNLLYW